MSLDMLLMPYTIARMSYGAPLDYCRGHVVLQLRVFSFGFWRARGGLPRADFFGAMSHTLGLELEV